MPRAGSAETRGDRGGQPASACLWGGAAYARAQKGQRGPAESWRERCGAGAEVGARRGRGGWTRGVGVSLSSRADRRHGQTERGHGRCLVPWSQRVRGLRRLVLPSLVREAGPGVRSFWAGPAFLGRRCLLSALCRGKELPPCQPSLGALSVPAE